MRSFRLTRTRRARHVSSRAHGATLVEFSLTFLVVTFVLFLLVEFSLWIHCYNTLADAAKAGVRYAQVHGAGTTTASQSGPNCSSGCTVVTTCTADSANVDAVKAEVSKWAGFSIYSTGAISITVCYMDGKNTPPSRVRVQVSNSVSPFFSIFGGTPPVTAVAQGRIVN
jgi:Flp pilus assembly protein TadG